MTDVMIHAAGASSKQVIFECHHHDVDAVDLVIAVSGVPEYCTIFHFPPSVCPSVRHRRDISTFLDNLMV